MEFQTRKIKEKDYDLLVSWWKDWGWDAVPKDMLPSNGDDGIMLEKDGEPIIAGFVYFGYDSIAWLDYIVADKNASRITRAKSLIYLLEVVEELVKKAGKKYIITVTDNKSLMSTFTKKNWYVDKDPLHKVVKIIK